MVYAELLKRGVLVMRRLVDAEKARRGCMINLGRLGKVRLKTGESATLGKYLVRVVEETFAIDGGSHGTSRTPDEASVLPERSTTYTDSDSWGEEVPEVEETPEGCLVRMMEGNSDYLFIGRKG